MAEKNNPLAKEIIRKLGIYAKQGDENDHDFVYRLARAINECPEDLYDKLSLGVQRWYVAFVEKFKKDGTVMGFPDQPYVPKEPVIPLATNILTQHYWNYDADNPSNHGIATLIRNMALARPYMTAKEIKAEIYRRYNVVVNKTTISSILSNFRAVIRLLWTRGLVTEEMLLSVIVPKGHPDPVDPPAIGQKL